MISVRGWKLGMNVKIWQNKEWRDFHDDPGIAIITSDDDALEGYSIHRYINTIPTKVRQAVRPIRYQQFSLLQHCSRLPAMKDLLVSAPLLAWMLTSKVIREKWSIEDISDLLSHKQLDILYEVAGVSAKADINFLRKVKLLNGTFQEQYFLLTVLRNNGLKHSIRHLPSIPVEVLAILLRMPALQGAELVPYIIKEGMFVNINDALNRIGNIKSEWDDVLRIAEDLSIADAEIALRRCRSEYELNVLHVRWIQRLNGEVNELYENVEFPDPPFPDTEYIQAIRTSGELYAEGRKMNHCVGAYAEEVLAGQCYIYRVFYPERATLEIRVKEGSWQIGQFKLKDNDEPGKGSKEKVMERLRQQYSV